MGCLNCLFPHCTHILFHQVWLWRAPAGNAALPGHHQNRGRSNLRLVFHCLHGLLTAARSNRGQIQYTMAAHHIYRHTRGGNIPHGLRLVSDRGEPLLCHGRHRFRRLLGTRHGTGTEMDQR